MSEMRILTVRQPWAWAIIHGGKDVENRVRNIAGDYRGPVAIHAGVSHAESIDTEDRLVSSAVGRLARAKVSAGMGMVPSRIDDPNDRHHWVHERFGNRGAIIGVVDLVGVHSDFDCGLCVDGCCGGCSEWAFPEMTHLELANPRPVDPIPFKGALGLRRLDEEMTARVLAAVSHHKGGNENG